LATIESRLSRLETVQQAPRRAYTDAERAVRYTYILSKGGPDADKLRELVEKAPDDDPAYA